MVTNSDEIFFLRTYSTLATKYEVLLPIVKHHREMECSLYVDVDGKSAAQINDGFDVCRFSGGIMTSLW